MKKEITEGEFKRIWNTVPVGLYHTSVEDGTFLKANQFCAKLFGCKSPDDLIGKKKSSQFYSPKQRIELIDRLRKNGMITDFEICLTLENGKQVWVCATAKLVDDGKIIEGSLTDITERKKLEVELEEYKNREMRILSDLRIKINKRLSEFQCARAS